MTARGPCRERPGSRRPLSMKKSSAIDVQRLRSDVEWALERGLGARDLVPMLEELRRHAEPGSPAALFADTELAEVLLDTSPWRSAVLARRVLTEVETDRAWAVLGLSLSPLGHYAAAKRAFAKALCLNPTCASYAHNLGHLLDVALDRPKAALPWLERAHRARPFEGEIAASYAHALVRLGSVSEARRVLVSAHLEEPEISGLLERWQA